MVIEHTRSIDAEVELEKANALIRDLVAVLEPFAAFVEEAEQFVEAAARNDSSPIMPTKHFCLSDFRKARAVIERAKDSTAVASAKGTMT